MGDVFPFGVGFSFGYESCLTNGIVITVELSVLLKDKLGSFTKLEDVMFKIYISMLL